MVMKDCEVFSLRCGHAIIITANFISLIYIELKLRHTFSEIKSTYNKNNFNILKIFNLIKKHWLFSIKLTRVVRSAKTVR